MFKQAIRYIAPNSSWGYSLPLPSYFDYLCEETRYTPDVATLELHPWQLYFACDETQPGHHKASILGEYQYKMPGFTQQSFNYWDSPIPFNPPVPLEASGYRNSMPNYPSIAKIKGQILLVRPQGLIDLDNYREQGVQFERRKVRIIVPYRALKRISDHPDLPTADIEWEANGIGLTFERVCTIRAWMYIGIPKYWDKMISAFDWTSVPIYNAKNRNWCKEYYQIRRPPKS